ncbi:hypothetical protein P3T43_001780 [Paraburkholderia sp. GAS41]
MLNTIANIVCAGFCAYDLMVFGHWFFKKRSAGRAA